MTTTLMLTIAVIAMLMFAMSLGVMISNRELQGSCGGVGNSCACDEAGEPVCDAKKVADAAAAKKLSADA